MNDKEQDLNKTIIKGADITNIFNKAVSNETDLDRKINENNIRTLKANNIKCVDNLTFLPRDYDTTLLPQDLVITLLMNDIILAKVCMMICEQNNKDNAYAYADDLIKRGTHNFNISTSKEEDIGTFDRLNDIFADKVNRQQLEGWTWHILRVPVYLWALNMWEPSLLNYTFPNAIIQKLLDNNKSIDEIFKNAKLRSKADILSMGNLFFRIKWAMEEYSIHNEPMPNSISKDYILEYCEAFRILLRWYNGGPYDL